jgi:5-(carboxyamino)imidazole ribonucleotide synthase
MTTTLGVVGGGQLGMFFVQAARDLGFATAVLDPEQQCPAGRFADHHHCSDYSDDAAVRRFASSCDAVTVEFENVPPSCLRAVASSTRMRPSPEAVAIAGDRRREKRFIRSSGLIPAPFEVLDDAGDVAEVMRRGVLDGVEVAGAVVKTAQLGYDGKGQVRIASLGSLSSAWDGLGRVPCVVEMLMPLDREMSVVVVRDAHGQMVTYPPTVNHHTEGILDTSVVTVDDPMGDQARQAARTIAEHLAYTGVLAVEFLVSDGALLVNEMAPRPHNSGHWTIDGASVSQFEQQARVLADLPLVEPRLVRPGVAMANLLGDLWRDGEPGWERLDGHDDVHLHLYGKTDARPGRKMGHLTVVRDTPAEALADARRLRALLVR